jgi:hypothetical protein
MTTIALVVLLVLALLLFTLGIAAGQFAAAAWMLVPIGVLWIFVRMTWERA